MKPLKAYDIELKKMTSPTETHHYSLGRAFFAAVESTEVEDGDIQAVVQVTRRTEKHYVLLFDLAGSLQLPCDRCLAPMSVPVETQQEVNVRLSEEAGETDDDLLLVPEDDPTLNVAWLMYEFIILSIPLKHVHPAGGCDPEMEKKLAEVWRETSADGTAENSLEEEDPRFRELTQEAKNKRPTDPRWDKLKDLLNN